MIRFRFVTPLGEVTLALDATDAAAHAELVYAGDARAVDVVSRWLEAQEGLRGVIIGRRASPKDIAHALKTPSASMFLPQVVEGADVLDSGARS
jgi:hypothetical protein